MHDYKSLPSLIHLLGAPGIGVRTIQKLLSVFGDADTARRAICASEELPCRVTAPARAYMREKSPAAVTEALRWQDSDALHHIVASSDDRYPALLKNIDDAPPLLFVHGHIEVLRQPMLAIVGSRNPTADGVQYAAQFACELGHAGYMVVSGLAVGIDGAAHRGAIEAECPTVAVLGSGIDICYPKSHRTLRSGIVAGGGALVSELLLGTQPDARNFPRRNRIISGLARGVLVVEAGLKSGSLITARYALEQGREVFAVPGVIANPLTKGPHYLIRQGAVLTESVEDILEECGAPRQTHAAISMQARPDEAIANDAKDPLLHHIGFTPITAAELAARSGKDIATIAAHIVTLELDGHIVTLPDGRIARKQSFAK